MSTEPYAFDPAIVAGVLHHMNDDHADDNLLFARAFGDPGATSARMHSNHFDLGSIMD